MTKKKTGLDRLDVNLLVPFAGPMAEKVKRISHANSMPNTMVVRMIMEIGIEEIEKGRELKLVIPSLKNDHAAA